MEPLGWLFWATAVGGAVAVVVAVLAPPRRRDALIIATALFLVAGGLGILSIGIIFIALAAACAVGAWRTGGRTSGAS